MAKAKPEAGFDQELYGKLHEAVVKGNTSKVQSLLQQFTKNEARDVLNRYCAHTSVPLLIVAIRNRHKNLVQLFIDHYDVRADQTDLKPPEDIDTATIEEWTPVLEGVVVRNPVILDILCKKAKNIDIGYPVHQACNRTSQGGRDTLNILLRHGAQINTRDKLGITPLIVACQYRNYDLINFLLQNGADVNLCSLDGNTPLHHLIERIEDCKKSVLKKNSPRRLLLQRKVKPETAEQTILKISKELLEHGMLQNPNEKGLTPLYLACLKGSEPIVEFLLDNLSVSVTDREVANCLELLASSILLKNGLSSTIRFKTNLIKPCYYLTKAMMLRHSHNPPLSKCRKQDNLETVLHQLETQTLEELATIKANVNSLITDLLFARQRILGVEVYNDYLLPFMGEYINYTINEHLYHHKANERRDTNHVVVLLNAFRLQRQSFIHPSSDTLKERIKWLDRVCRHVKMFGTVNISVFGAILDSIEEFYKCRNSENAHMTKDTYVLLLDFLHCIVTNVLIRNDECINIKSLTKRCLRLTKSSMESNLNPSTTVLNKIRPCGNCMCNQIIPTKLVTGDNVLHIACREIKGTSCQREMLEISNRAREGLVELLKTLHACGEDVNAQNSDGQTPLHVFVSDHRVTRYRYRQYSLKYFDFPEAVRSLLLAGANPDLRDKSQATTLHGALSGYAHFFHSLWLSGVDLKELNSMVELLLKSGANPQARDSQGFSPLHALMDAVFPNGRGYNSHLASPTGTQSPDLLAHNRVPRTSTNHSTLWRMCTCHYQ